MPLTTIDDLKVLETPGTPLFVCDCTLPSGDVQRWSTHSVVYLGNTYSARIVQHTLFDLRSSSDEATDGISQIALTLANADAELSGDRAQCWLEGLPVNDSVPLLRSHGRHALVRCYGGLSRNG